MRDTYEVLDLADPWNGRYLSVWEPTLSGEDRRHVYIGGCSGRTAKMIAIDEVILFKAEDKYTFMHHTGGENIVIHTLKELERLFPASILRIRRGTLVNKDRIKSCKSLPGGRGEVQLVGYGETLVASRRHVSEVRQLILKRGAGVRRENPGKTSDEQPSRLDFLPGAPYSLGHCSAASAAIPEV